MLQFRLRDVGFGATGAAVLLAVAAFWMRDFDAQQRILVLAIWSGSLASATAVAVGFGVLRYRAERQAGQAKLTLQLPGFQKWLINLFGYGWMMVAAGAVVFISGRHVYEGDVVLWESPFGSFLVGTPWGCFLGFGFAFARSREHTVELREHGILQGWSFAPWSQVHYRWKGEANDILVLQRGVSVSVKVGAKELREVRSLIARLNSESFKARTD